MALATELRSGFKAKSKADQKPIKSEIRKSARSSVGHPATLGSVADQTTKLMSEHLAMDEYQEELLEYRAAQEEPEELAEDATEL